MTHATVKSERLQLRATPSQCKILSQAAEVTSQTTSSFVLDSAMAAADHVLGERRSFTLAPDKWAAFMDALDAPAKNRPRLKHLLQTPSV